MFLNNKIPCIYLNIEHGLKASNVSGTDKIRHYPIYLISYFRHTANLISGTALSKKTGKTARNAFIVYPLSSLPFAAIFGGAPLSARQRRS